VSDVDVGPASVDQVRAVQVRRTCDDVGLRLALEFAERGLAWTARDQDDVVGIALVDRSDDERYVGDLFVEPSYRGQGIGARLLDAALASDDDASEPSRRALRDGGERAGLALALRRGLAPRTTVLQVAGSIPREDGLLAMAAGDYRFQVDAIDPAAHAFALNALDRETRGTTRLAEHERFGRSAAGLAFFSDGEFVAYAYAWADGRIGPLATVSSAYVVQIFAYALVTMARTFGASWCSALIPGTNLRLARAALRAGLRIEGSFALSADAELPDLARYAGFHPLLF
jgi:GNAT superfamily N-acetyltransferase